MVGKTLEHVINAAHDDGNLLELPRRGILGRETSERCDGSGTLWRENDCIM